MDRRYGNPRLDVERVANHYGITIEEAEILLSVYPVEQLLPERGYGLMRAGQAEEQCNCWPLLIIGLIMGGSLTSALVISLKRGR